MITLYSAATGNGYRASILLEELGLPYDLRLIDFAKASLTRWSDAVLARSAVQRGLTPGQGHAA